jgi:hypothetical protein
MKVACVTMSMSIWIGFAVSELWHLTIREQLEKAVLGTHARVDAVESLNRQIWAFPFCQLWCQAMCLRACASKGAVAILRTQEEREHRSAELKSKPAESFRRRIVAL